MKAERELARCRGFDFGIEDHGMPVLVGSFEGEGWGQGFGYMVDVAFLMRFMGVFGVERLQQVNGMSCWITHDHGQIYKVEPLHKNDGEPFVLLEWENWTKTQSRPSAYEMRTGKKP